MKWFQDRIGRLAAARSEQSESDNEPHTPGEVHKTKSVPNLEFRASSSHPTETPFDAKRKELGVEDSLKDIPGVTDRMLVAFGEHGIKSLENLAAYAPD